MVTPSALATSRVSDVPGCVALAEGGAAVRINAVVGRDASMAIETIGDPTQKQRSMTASSRSHCMMQPSRELE